jgi:hypothetical protein
MLKGRPFTIYTNHKPVTFALGKPWTEMQPPCLSLSIVWPMPGRMPPSGLSPPGSPAAAGTCSQLWTGPPGGWRRCQCGTLLPPPALTLSLPGGSQDMEFQPSSPFHLGRLGCTLPAAGHPASANHRFLPLSPQGNGMVEQYHRRLKDALRARLAGPDWAS